jgi:diguanylate cyclase (GGDEF)-like protein
MMNRLEQSVSGVKRNGRAFSLVMMDIDRFKEVNDTLGHPAGDQILIHVAEFLRHGTRETDEISRWGGEEFLILLQDTELSDAVDQAERLRAALSERRFPVEGTPVGITASFGLGAFTGDQSLQALLKQIDARLYQAKNQGRNRVVAADA